MRNNLVKSEVTITTQLLLHALQIAFISKNSFRVILLGEFLDGLVVIQTADQQGVVAEL